MRQSVMVQPVQHCEKISLSAKNCRETMYVQFSGNAHLLTLCPSSNLIGLQCSSENTHASHTPQDAPQLEPECKTFHCRLEILLGVANLCGNSQPRLRPYGHEDKRESCCSFDIQTNFPVLALQLGGRNAQIYISSSLQARQTFHFLGFTFLLKKAESYIKHEQQGKELQNRAGNTYFAKSKKNYQCRCGLIGPLIFPLAFMAGKEEKVLTLSLLS